ncbi:MAG: acyl-CoA dehydrogenase family protein [Desulfobacterales bacterium]|nr:acyl-CoA dehydrogenase family protein [Desulfobacterales bacterium]
MEFALDKSRKEIQKAVREFARGKFDKETIVDLLRSGEFPSQIWKKAAELGFFGIHFPEAYDGGGMDLLDYALAAEQMCKQDSAAGIALMLAGFGAECLFRFETGPPADKYLPLVAAGKMRAAAALFEYSQGAELSGIQTTAVQDGDAWILNGTKVYVPNGASAGFYVVLCKTGPDAETPKNNLSLIVADTGSQGITAAPAGPSLGGNLIDFAHVTFENVRVPAENRIGKTGAGARQAQCFIDECRIQTAAMALGTAQGACDRAVSYTKQRRQFGKKLVDFQVTRHKLADMAARIDAARWTVYSAAAAFDTNRCDAKTAAQAKLTATSAAMAAVDEAVQLLGGYGYMTEYEIEHFYRDAKTLEIFMGPPAALKDVIAGGLIGRRS